MSQGSATKLIPKLQFKLHDRRRLSNPEGPQGRHNKIKKIVTALFKYERLELNYHKADESRGYAERLLSDAIRHGDTHKPTMEMASYWIIDKAIIHKLFKVLAPRYKDFKISYTKLWRAPNVYPGYFRPKSVLELRNNIFPPLLPDQSYKKNLIHNVLLEEARKAYRQEKAQAGQGKPDGEQTESRISNENHLNMKENVHVNTAVETDVESSEISRKDVENELPNEENLEADNESETKEKKEVNSAEEKDLDFSNMKTAEETQVESLNKEGKN